MLSSEQSIGILTYTQRQREREREAQGHTEKTNKIINDIITNDDKIKRTNDFLDLLRVYATARTQIFIQRNKSSHHQFYT